MIPLTPHYRAPHSPPQTPRSYLPVPMHTEPVLLLALIYLDGALDLRGRGLEEGGGGSGGEGGSSR